MYRTRPLSAWRPRPALVTLAIAGLMLSATVLVAVLRLGYRPGDPGSSDVVRETDKHAPLAPTASCCPERAGQRRAETALTLGDPRRADTATSPVTLEKGPRGDATRRHGPSATGTPGVLQPEDTAHWLQPLDEHLQSVLALPLLHDRAAEASFDTASAAGPELSPALAAPTSVGKSAGSNASNNLHPDRRSRSAPASAPSTAYTNIPEGANAAALKAHTEHSSLATAAPQEISLPSASASPPVTAAPNYLPPAGLAAGGQPAVPTANPMGHSEEMELIAADADRHTRRGYELAGRNAFFAARSEFVTALRLIADGLDTQHSTAIHQPALTAGLTALRECDDFVPRGSRLESDLHLAEIVRTHRTPVLKSVDPSRLATLESLHRYISYAQQQLAVAAGGEVAGSMALQGLGKAYAAVAAQKTVSLVAAESKAMTYYQAALLVCPQNYMASNELGVLLARCGREADARIALEHSLSIQPNPAGWHNLATVYRQLGLGDRAQRAERLAQLTRQSELAGLRGQARVGASTVEWVDSQAFAQMYAASRAAVEPLPPRSVAAPEAWSRPMEANVAQRPQNPNSSMRK